MNSMAEDDAAKVVHQAINTYLDEGELAVRWVLVVDVVGQNNDRYVAQRSGGGVDGTDKPMLWESLGLVQATLGTLTDQLKDITFDLDSDYSDEDDD